ncbi:hypothetical protein TURU_107474 [Turdus rufiventris]|nr:hypothetical protein TURU_107474 [Turdus rufiventris]
MEKECLGEKMEKCYIFCNWMAKIKAWVDKMQEDLVTLARTASGVDRLAEIYLKNTALYTVEANNPRQLVELAARDIEKLLSNRSKALVARKISSNESKITRSVSKHFYDNTFELLGRFFEMYLCDIYHLKGEVIGTVDEPAALSDIQHVSHSAKFSVTFGFAEDALCLIIQSVSEGFEQHWARYEPLMSSARYQPSVTWH